MEPGGARREYAPMSPTDIHLIHAAAAHTARVSRRGRRAR